jgi:hypothetical protein
VIWALAAMVGIAAFGTAIIGLPMWLGWMGYSPWWLAIMAVLLTVGLFVWEWPTSKEAVQEEIELRGRPRALFAVLVRDPVLIGAVLLVPYFFGRLGGSA